MGGRTTMQLALTSNLPLDKVVVVDVSPVNQVKSFKRTNHNLLASKEFDVTSSSQWNMEHFFHCLKAVTFDQSLSISGMTLSYHLAPKVFQLRENLPTSSFLRG